MSDRTFVVHGLPAMTLGELAVLRCGHCRHGLSQHVTRDGGHTFCAICHCLRGPDEDIRQPHWFIKDPQPTSAGTQHPNPTQK